MSKDKIIVVGAGGHSHAILDILIGNEEYDVLGLLDNDKNSKGAFDIPLLGGEDLLEKLYAEGVRKAHVAIGDNDIRKRNCRMLEKLGFELINVVSRNAYVSKRSVIGCGVAIMHGAAVNAGTAIGDGAIINTRAVVDHDSKIGNFAHVAPGVVLCGKVDIGDGAFVGAGSTVIQCLRVGEESTVAAGAAVIKEVPDFAIVAGVPASVIKYKE